MHGSRDSSLSMIRELHHHNSRIRYLSLARKFGDQVAVTAGLKFVPGNSIIVIDADLQDPPELILTMIDKWHEGYQVVYTEVSILTNNSSSIMGNCHQLFFVYFIDF
ncbi:MAG: hypothetical protein RLZZ507_2163 [Cyanobacteriota bacterium]|jgi:dolichol-phosphate mannosyltransferase